MRTEPVPSGRAKIEEGSGSSLRIVLPPRRHTFLIIFLCVWLGGWFAGERSAIQQLAAAKDPAANGFLLFWLAGWSFGGAFAIFITLWMTLGREILELRSDVLMHGRSILGIGRNRAYDLEQVRALRLGVQAPGFFNAAKKPDLSRAADAWGLSGGPIVFDYGAKTIRCGAALDEAEAKQIIERLIQRNGRLAPRGAA